MFLVLRQIQRGGREHQGEEWLILAGRAKGRFRNEVGKIGQ